ncbi:MAG: hypothetical protein H0T99_10705 [Geodermatophilaceae bacterium]|nr:hypothetical protein [Geodermatophilaceae bacterium]MDQ3477256.1 hypothetical protein [Actinomycetota bacterium]
MCDEDGLGVDTCGADQAGVEAATLAERYTSIGTDFQLGMTHLREASTLEMAVMTGAMDYAATVIEHLTRLQEFTGALGESAQQAAAAARQADYQIGTGLGSVYAA